MKKFILFTLLITSFKFDYAQRIYDYKVKNESNNADRTMMLDILRAKLYETYKQEFVFVVNHFKVGGNYAWLMADVQRKDGKKVRMLDDGDGWDCCHIETLFKKSGTKWYVAESGEFSTDVWWWEIFKRFPDAPKDIFDDLGKGKEYSEQQ